MTPWGRKKPLPTPQPFSILSLPDELLLSCVAHVSRLYYPILSCVSKRFRTLIISPELYKTRSLLGLTESCLYVCIKFGPEDHRWFSLYRKPKDGSYILANIPIPSPHSDFTGLVAVGSNIYNVAGQYMNEEFSSAGYSTFSILDCVSHTWRKATNLPVKLFRHTASVIDQNVYVAGLHSRSGSSIETAFHVFDTKTQVWNDKKPSPEFLSCASASIDGKFYVDIWNKTVAYSYKEGKWEAAEEIMRAYMWLEGYCEIDNVLYSAVSIYDGVRWCDSKVHKWREMKGLVGLPLFPFPPAGSRCACVKLAGCGGKMAIFWEDYGAREKKIWCAKIALERHECGEIWGEVEWFGHVLTIPKSCGLVKALAVTL